MHGTLGSVSGQLETHKGGAQGRAFECVIHGIPISANNNRKAAQHWRRHVAQTAAAQLADWRLHDDGDLSAVIVFFHTGPFKGDTDNIPKHVLDGLSGLVYDDDRHISQVVVRRTCQDPGVDLADPPPLVAAHLGATPNFVYVRIEAGPDHGIMPKGAVPKPAPGDQR